MTSVKKLTIDDSEKETTGLLIRYVDPEPGADYSLICALLLTFAIT